ncbi:hypothetical protein [Paenibacillus sp. Soil787]|uniref:hypothetical protein n=1 Tax=Paenibacillus sp. Soil787 TaxID=1736411 RepID=UPI0006FB0457|nr:hypothetical protein [Paenibacillus sp. Soil787]KRF35854.1 hypothetical protein ASG93_25565 [Paenibacillus sp. Soil787]
MYGIFFGLGLAKLTHLAESAENALICSGAPKYGLRTEDVEVRVEFHRLADELRKVSGQQ